MGNPTTFGLRTVNRRIAKIERRMAKFEESLTAVREAQPSEPTNLDEYTKGWESKPLWLRIRNRICWMADSVWSAIVMREGPGEKLLLAVLRARKNTP